MDRVGVIRKVLDRELKPGTAAQQPGLIVRQVKWLVRAMRQEGPAGLASKRRGRPGNNRIAETVKAEFMSLVRRHYPDFGPTLAHEKLVEQHDFSHSVETLRAWMVADCRATP